MRARRLEATAFALVLGCSRPAEQAAVPAVDPAPAPAEPAVVPGPAAQPQPSPASAPGPPLPTPAQAGDPSRDKLQVTENEYQGWRYFHVYCERCHGTDALGTVDAPDLRYSVSAEGEVTRDSFGVVVRKGTENKEENKVMKGFEDLLDDQRIDQLYAYVKARSEGRLAAGRPHRPPPP